MTIFYRVVLSAAFLDRLNNADFFRKVGAFSVRRMLEVVVNR